MIITDFMNNPIIVGDIVLETYLSRMRAGKVIQINSKSITVTCRRAHRYRARYAIDNTICNNIKDVIKDLKTHNGQRFIRRWEYTLQYSNLINLTYLNLIFDENS